MSENRKPLFNRLTFIITLHTGVIPPMPKPVSEPSKLFVIYGHKDVIHAVLMLPEVTNPEIVTAAWAYAVTFSAKGLNRPDYDAALELLRKRHPSWQVLGTDFTRIDLQLGKADDDVAEA